MGSAISVRIHETDERGTTDYADLTRAIRAIPSVLERFELSDLDAIGHRVAHGGGKFAVPAIIDDATIAEIEALTPLAPLHNPANLQPVRLCRTLWLQVPQVAVFDTSFHNQSGLRHHVRCPQTMA